MPSDALLDNQAYCHHCLTPALLLFGCLSGWLIAAPMAIAQVTPDGSLSTTVNTSGNNFTIENGNRVGNNLFHSFSEFSIPTNGSAFFNNAADIQNIFSRVTGGKTSNIDGLISLQGRANLFLLNPAGIVFGPNARLNIGGSFFGTSAESVLFQDGSVFSTKPANTSPLLTVSVPVGLQMGTNSGAIQVRGTGHRISGQIAGFSPLDRSKNPIGLQVPSGNTLALIGSNVQLDGGILHAAGGRVELGAVRATPGTAAATVKLNSTGSAWQFDYASIENLGNIDLSGRALVDISGEGGKIHLQGANVTMVGGSALFVNSQGSQPGGNIRIDALESIVLSGTANGLSTLVRQEVSGTGSGGDIELATRNLLISDLATIQTHNLSAASSGKITIAASQSVQVEGPPSSSDTSTIRSITVSNGAAGDAIVSSPQVRVLEQGGIFSISFSKGNSGNVIINASESIESKGIIAATTFVAGNGGTVRLNTSRLLLRDGGRVSASTFGTGDAGRIEIDASESVEVIGTGLGTTNNQTRINSNAQLANLGFQSFGAPPTPSGNAGGIAINTPFLRVSDRGQVTVGNAGSGNAGVLQLNADTIVLDNGGQITAATRSGEGGNIALNVRDSLQLRDGSAITSEAGGTGNGGNITIDSDTITLLENSRINANAFEGKGGSIQISTPGLFASRASSITASSQFGISGTVATKNPEVDTSSFLVQLPQNLLNASQQIISSCAANRGNTFTVTGRGGLPEDPTSGLLGRAIWWDSRDLSDINLTAVVPPEKLPLSEPTPEIVEATGWIINNKGQVELVAQNHHRIPVHNTSNCRLIVTN